jgi:DNA-binding response OmpR family regulator
MATEPRSLEQVFADKRILIVEDDDAISSELAELFFSLTKVKPVVASWIGQADSVVCQAVPPFNLAVLDVMLPLGKADYNKILENKKALAQIREELQALYSLSAEQSGEQIKEKRAQRGQILDESSRYIRDRGGIDLARKWREDAPELVLFPILFLTCVGDKKSVDDGLHLNGGHTDWIVKPALTEVILDKCRRLLCQ